MCEQVFDPPIIGFDIETIKLSLERSKRLKLFLDNVESLINIRTSTPLKGRKDFRWDNICKEAFKMMASAAKIIDNDSGYISNHQESNSTDIYQETMSHNTKDKFVYMNEDALLEKPISSDQSRIEDSVSCEETECFPGLKDSMDEESGISEETNVSPFISNIDPIVLTEETLEKIVQSVPKIDLITENCDNDSNAENNANYLNIHSRTATLLSLSILDKNKEKEVAKSVEKSIEEPQKSSYKNVQLFNIIQTPQKSYKNPINPNFSPDLFSDNELDTSQNSPIPKVEFKEKYILRQDRKLYRRAKEMLIGVPPPICLQHVNLNVSDMLKRYEENKHLILTKEEVEEKNLKGESSSKNCEATFLITQNGFESIRKEFPSVLEERYYGLHYNRSKLSEEMEQLAMKYASKYIGSETQSSCTVFRTNFPSSPSKVSNKLRWTIKSPGKRLSHLARRRITFSSATLQAQTRQIAVDPSRLKVLSRNRSPLKKSPRKTPKKSPTKKIKTPSSSAKKKLSLQIRLMAEQMPGSSKIANTKRALFQSPEKGMKNSCGGSTNKVHQVHHVLSQTVTSKDSISPFRRRTNLKCVLFASPTKSSPSKIGNKRKRTDSETVHPSKLPRSFSLSEVNENKQINHSLVRVKSEAFIRSPAQRIELSETHKKKLLWAIYETLRAQKINMSHPNYKQYAGVLCRVTKRYLPDLSANAPRPEGGTSERMLKIARLHVGAVLQGKSVDEIVQEYEQRRLKTLKPSGYVSLENVKKMDVSQAKENVLKENDVNLKDRDNVLKDRVNVQSVGVNLVNREVKKVDRIDKVRKVINF
ncbi:uncharacterized protein [Onthophagus taurus]|uniref:uncharacterized protein n=1 Tax=Onthophagus taurus TaxID=166361 RepID=UPI0039BEA4F1